MPTSQLAESSAPAPAPLAAALTPRATPQPRRTAHFTAWHLDMGDHGSAPGSRTPRVREQHVDWDADRSGTVTVTGADGELRRTDFAAGRMPVVFADTPPAAAHAMEAYLRSGGSVDDPDDPVQLVDAVAEMLNEWTLPVRHQSAVVLMLARMPGIIETGPSVDPLGRLGTAYLAASPSDERFAAVLTVSADGARILSVETVYRGGVPELDLAVPAVVRSVSWR
jgi:hypothetical protein